MPTYISIAICGTLVSIYEGYKGLSDKHVGYSEATDYCRRSVDIPAENYALDVKDDIDDLLQEQIERSEIHLEELEDFEIGANDQLTDLRLQLTDHNSLISDIRMQLDTCYANDEFIQQQKVERLDGQILDELQFNVEHEIRKIKTCIDITDNTVELDISDLKTVAQNAISDIDLALSHFFNTTLRTEEQSCSGRNDHVENQDSNQYQKAEDEIKKQAAQG